MLMQNWQPQPRSMNTATSGSSQAQITLQQSEQVTVIPEIYSSRNSKIQTDLLCKAQLPILAD